MKCSSLSFVRTLSIISLALISTTTCEFRYYYKRGTSASGESTTADAAVELPFRTQVSSTITFNNNDGYLHDRRLPGLSLEPESHHSHHAVKPHRNRVPRCENLQQTEGNVTGMDKCPSRVKNLIGNSIKQLACKPRPQIVKLKVPGPNFDLLPSVAIVNRCDGFCRSSTSCLPTKVSTKQILVHQIDKARVGMFSHECAMVELEEHDECKCHCEIQPADCSHKQKYDPGSCSCHCTNVEEQFECQRHQHQQEQTTTSTMPSANASSRRKRLDEIFFLSVLEPEELLIHRRHWNPSTCTCNCHTEEESFDDNNNCPNDLMWIPKLCRCIRVPMTMIPPDSRFGMESTMTTTVTETGNSVLGNEIEPNPADNFL